MPSFKYCTLLHDNDKHFVKIISEKNIVKKHISTLEPDLVTSFKKSIYTCNDSLNINSVSIYKMTAYFIQIAKFIFKLVGNGSIINLLH